MSKCIVTLICMQIVILCMLFSTVAYIVDPRFGFGRWLTVLAFGTTSLVTGRHYRDRTG